MLELIGAGRLAAFAAFLLGVGLWQPVIAAEQSNIVAFAVVQGQGQTYPTDVKQGTFIGTFVGTMYTLTDQGPQDSGDLVCPAVITFDLADKSQIAHARCSISNKDGAAFYGELSCTGTELAGCNGDFKITGGTGRFAGITGSGKALVRAESRSIGDKDANGAVPEQAKGIIYWRDLQYKIP